MSRMARLESRESIRAIVLPVARNTRSTDRTMTRRALREERIAYLDETSEQAFYDIDEQLAASGGRRLTRQPNRLGFIIIEATANAIAAIAELEWVGSIVEDQPVYVLDEVEARPSPKPQLYSWNSLSGAQT
jgi:hypothetical protein